jgi:hypothetical protein
MTCRSATLGKWANRLGSRPVNTGLCLLLTTNWNVLKKIPVQQKIKQINFKPCVIKDQRFFSAM